MRQLSMLSSFDVEIPMRDGTILRGDLYRPMELAPVLLIRTVFRKNLFGRSFQQYEPSYYVKRGFAVFIQDVRGLGMSDGEFDRFTADGPDGYDTIEWLAAQPWCTGSVGMMGSYYSGYLQLMAAWEAPPHLKAICPMQTSVSINRDCDTRGFLFSSHIGWCMSRLVSRLRDGRYDTTLTKHYLPIFLQALKDYPDSQLKAVPLSSMPVLQDTPFPLLKDYFKHLVKGYDDLQLLHKEGRDMDVSRIRIPAFYIAGWYDSSRTALIDHCMAQRKAGVDSRVLIAPWKPGEMPARPDGALENGEYTIDLPKEITAWFEHWLKDGPSPDYPPVRYYDIASDGHYSGQNWPPEQVRILRLYPADHLSLCPEEQSTCGSISFVHDPSEPLPYHPYGPESNDSHSSGKVIWFNSDPLSKPLLLSGFQKVTISASSSVYDADIMVSLAEKRCDGTQFNICDGASRLSYRYSWNREPLVPDTICRTTILMGNVQYQVSVGSRLCLEISGSAFPKYDVNHGTGKAPANDDHFFQSMTTIHYGKGTGSELILSTSD